MDAILDVFPDARFTIEAFLAEGDQVAIRHTLRSTHRAELQGVPATATSFGSTPL